MTPDKRVAPTYTVVGEPDPLWKAAARGARRGFYRTMGALESLAGGSGALLMPPAHLRALYYRTAKRAAFVRACEGARGELVSRGLRPDHRLLDVGSGIGNLAVALVGFLEGGYDGVEVSAEAVGWCQRTITRAHPSFRFHRADLASRAYNPRGRLSAAQYRFPFADGRFDFIFLGSVFTHMFPDGIEQYVHEIARLLTPGGVCVASYFLVNDENRAALDAGRSFLPFPVKDPSGLCRWYRADVPEAAVAVEEPFIREIHARAGLRIDDVRRGGWWSGKADDQDIVTARAAITG